MENLTIETIPCTMEPRPSPRLLPWAEIMLFLSAGLSVALLKHTILPTDQTGFHMELKGRGSHHIPHQESM